MLVYLQKAFFGVDSALCHAALLSYNSDLLLEEFVILWNLFLK